MLSFEQLIQNLTDTTQPSIVRSSAIAGIVAQRSPQSVKLLTEALADADAMIRREATKALQDLHATSATETLIHALQTESNDLTFWAMLEAISELGTPSVLPMLESMLNIDSMLTRIEVKKSISRIQDRYADEATATSPDEPSSPPVELTATNPPVDPPTEPTETELDERADTVESPESQLSDASAEIVGDTEPTETAKTSASLPNDLDEEDEEIGTDSEDVSETAETAKTSASLPNDFDEEDEKTVTDSEDVSETADDTPFTEASVETTDEMEEPESVAPDQEPPQREDDTDIRDLSDAIARSPRLAGSSVNLPVLAPNASTVPYHPNGTALEPAHTNFFLTLLHPTRYFSKQWMSRTRAYLILWAVLIAGVIGFTQHQKHFRATSDMLPRIGLTMDELPELVRRSLAEGDFHIQEGYYRKAINAYEMSRELGTLPINFYRKLGFAYFKEGQYALAVEAYELFLEARGNEAPDMFAAEASLVGVYPLTSIGRGTTQDYETYNILGTAYAKLGRVLDAQRAYEQAIRIAPKYGEAYNNLARLYANNYQQPLTAGIGNPKISPKLRLAEALAYTAVTLNPDIAAYHDTLGWILSKRGQVNKAMKTLERAISLQKDAVEPHYHLAQVAMEANERKKAVKAIQNVFKLEPAFVSLNTAE